MPSSCTAAIAVTPGASSTRPDSSEPVDDFDGRAANYFAFAASKSDCIEVLSSSS